MSQNALKTESSLHGSAGAIEIPTSLKNQLREFRNRVWTIKLAESLLTALVIVGLSLLTVYALDRWFDTPRAARGVLFLLSVVIWFVLPRALYRWVWKHRQLDQLARLLRQREPNVGDQLLSAIEIANDSAEQGRSPKLCMAAIEQVADVAKQRDLRLAAPGSWLRELSIVLLLTAMVLGVLSLAFPSAFDNAIKRLAFPWRDTPRFTFATINSLNPDRIVPHGETSGLVIELSSTTQSRPKFAHLKIGRLPVLSAAIQDDGQYQFEVPPLTDSIDGILQVGDYSQSLHFQPLLRPSLTDVVAYLELPGYLQQTSKPQLDIRSGKLVAVDGTTAKIRAVASRELAAASLNDSAIRITGDVFETDSISVDSNSVAATLFWQDKFGLTPSDRFQVEVQAAVDEAPSVIARELPRQLVVMESEQVNFEALASDDFGLKRIGMSWKGLDENIPQLASGEKSIAAGGPELTSVQSQAVFCATALGITAQPIELRLWAEDYKPDRPRVESSPHILFVLTAEQHAIWIMDQLSKWHKAAIDVRDKEMQLHEENKRLRELTEDQMADEKMRDALRKQAALENANARRLAALSQNGEKLLKTATRNPEIGVGHLERWAEMLQVLNDIGNNRMPSVADLLDEASTEKKLARGGKSDKPSGPMAGKNRDSKSGQPGSESEPEKDKPKTMPSISDRESSLAGDNQDEAGESGKPKKKKGNGSKLGLPTTTIAGSPPPNKPEDNSDQPEEEEEDSTVNQAVQEQEDLLAEFQKITDEMNEVLANLEGSTIVKRLKAASRDQMQVAEKIVSRLNSSFGSPGKATAEDKKVFSGLATAEETHRQSLSFIMDDIQAYFDRRRMNQFKLVLDEMKDSKILDAIDQLSDSIPRKQGVSIAEAEFWADNLDRWADDLVDPACSGQCPGSKSSDALPPSLILEAMRILEAEVNLREATRVAQQAKEAVTSDEHNKEAKRLSETQDDLTFRTEDLIAAIKELPNGEQRFPKDIALLGEAAKAMNDATGILEKHDTGAPAIAAETEAIEWLLRSRKINPRGGGGGGTDPGGGGTGTTSDSALALIGSGINAKEKRESRQVAQVTGEKTKSLPEEYRQGLDQYFNQLEQPE